MTPSPDSPPTNTSPYQSRLFNFLNRQRWVWRDRFTQVGRTIQHSVIWGGQVVLYPLYLLTQLGRGFGLRLGAAVSGRPKFPQQPELPTSDRPIRNILEQLQELLGEERDVLEAMRPLSVLPPTASTPTLQSTRNPIRAIASLLPSQQLALVDRANLVQNCLTSAQQQILRQRIYQELLANTQQRYLLQVHPQHYRIPPQFRQNPQLWPPVQRFWRLMHWLQGGPAATTANLFGEAELAEVLALSSGPDLPLGFQLSPPLEHRLVWQMDEAIAALEQQQAELNAQLNQWWQTEAAPSPNPLTKLRKTVQLGLGVLLGTTDLDTLNPEPLNAESAVWVNWEELTDHSRDQFVSLVPPDASVIEAEMSLDLSLPTTAEQSLPPSFDAPATAQTPPRLQPQTTVSSPPTLASSSVPDAVEHQPGQPQTSTATPTVASLWSPNLASTQTPTSPTDPSQQPDWIEVESQATGYEVHFFAQVLNGFDRVMLVIEEFVLALGRWVQRLLARLL